MVIMDFSKQNIDIMIDELAIIRVLPLTLSINRCYSKLLNCSCRPSVFPTESGLAVVP